MSSVRAKRFSARQARGNDAVPKVYQDIAGMPGVLALQYRLENGRKHWTVEVKPARYAGLVTSLEDAKNGLEDTRVQLEEAWQELARLKAESAEQVARLQGALASDLPAE